jgi:hypothetical protein
VPSSKRLRTLLTVAALVLAGLGLAACSHVPEDASKAAFCEAGQKFSALQKVTFARGQDAIERLAKVGTPADIDSDARAGFVELIDRMRASDNAGDFRERTRTMSEAQRDHLFALDTYIQGTCSDRVPLSATKAAFCSARAAYARLTPAQFSAAQAAVAKLAQVGTPDDINASARLGFIEVIDRVNSSQSAEDFAAAVKAMTTAEKDHVKALDDYTQTTCS